MMRDFARAAVIVAAFLLLVAEVQRDDSVNDAQAPAVRAAQTDF